MTALEYRCTMWICQKLSQDRTIPEECCAPIALFEYMMETHHSWGRYAIYMTWLHRQFPTQGSWIFHYLKTLFFMDVFIVLFVSTVVHVSWRKNCRTPMSILPNLAR